MKLKSKLIATVVSMCAAIAVMGVGVWASTAQNFTVTVNNDVDVMILNVQADVYGEFAVYSQFMHSDKENTAVDTTPMFATKIDGSATEGKLGTAYKNHDNVDHGYLLYARGIGGYNDGLLGTFTAGNASYEENTMVDYGYSKFINEAKNNIFLATANGELKNTNSNDTATTSPYLRENWSDADKKVFKNSYNVDYTTHVAQATYLYTINQWGAGDNTNNIFAKVDTSLSQATIDKIKKAINQDKAYNSLIVPNVYVGKVTDITQATYATTWNKLDPDANGVSAFEIPAAEKDQTYYIMVTFTFARNNANLDLKELQDALRHTLRLDTEDTKDASTTYTAFSGLTAATLNYATAGARETGTGKYKVTGASFQPNTADIKAKVSVNYDDARLKNCYAIVGADDLTKRYLPNGFLYEAGADDYDEGGMSDSYQWIKELYEDKATTKVPYAVSHTPTTGLTGK